MTECRARAEEEITVKAFSYSMFPVCPQFSHMSCRTTKLEGGCSLQSASGLCFVHVLLRFTEGICYHFKDMLFEVE